MAAPAILAKHDHRKIIERYISGESYAVLSAELGISHQAFYAWMLRTDEEAWRNAQISKALATLETAQEEVSSADSMLAIARAREKLVQARWTLEKLFRRLFGNDPAIALQINEFSTKPTEGLLEELRELLIKK